MASYFLLLILYVSASHTDKQQKVRQGHRLIFGTLKTRFRIKKCQILRNTISSTGTDRLSKDTSISKQEDTSLT